MRQRKPAPVKDDERERKERDPASQGSTSRLNE